MICGIYKYVWHDEIVYIGKADKDIMSRIAAHKAESKFQPYLKDCVIWYTECVNPAHTTILETYLINKYKPRLNVSMKYGDILPIQITEPKWETIDNIPYDETTPVKRAKKQKVYGDIWVRNRQKDIKRLKEEIACLKWAKGVLDSHYGQYSFKTPIPEWVAHSGGRPAINTKTKESGYDYLHIWLFPAMYINDETHEYSAEFADQKYIEERTEDEEDCDFWRDYKSLIFQTIKIHKNHIREIEEQIRTNEELRHELERKRVVV